MPVALKQFADFCDADVGHLMVADGNRTLLQSTFSVDMDPVLAELEAELQDINPRVLAIPRMRPMISTRDRDFITRDEIAKDAVYQELILPLGLGHFSAVPIVNAASLTAGVALHRRFEHDAFDDDAAKRHEIAAAVCAPVFNLARLVEKRRADDALSFAGEGDAAAILKTDTTVVEFNRAFDECLSEKRVTLDSNRKLLLGRPEFTAKLHRALSKRSNIVGGSFITKDDLGRPEYIVSIMPFHRVGIAGELAGAAVFILKPIRKARKLNMSLVKETFGLTRAEAETAQLLMQGASLPMINKTRAVSVHTTQTLIKRVLAKTECRRQTELIVLLTPFLN